MTEVNRLLEVAEANIRQSHSYLLGAAEAKLVRKERALELSIKALHAAIEAIDYARRHIDGEIDVEDGDYGQPRPNKAMQLASTLDDAMDILDRALNEAEKV